ncbi:MAG: SGNH/GDSL hydrolase family protein [Acidiferrobacterales bacterium]|nr:SGNH/GDSL hydrolase family protein [Acidiferrobacterales bacterium]
MNSTCYLKGLGFLFLWLWLATAANAQQSYSNFIAFGDSLSDTGNLASVTLPFPFPFYQNRVSDGPVALDILAESLGFSATASLHLTGSQDGFNYAVAGGNIVGTDWEDLEPQVSAYLSRINNTSDSQALYTVIMGGNDLRGIRSISSSAAAEAEIELILDQLIAQLTRLSDAGAQNFFIANVANIGRLPETLKLGATIVAQAQSYTQSYNAQLTTRLDNFAQQSGASVSIFDLYAVLEEIINNASQFGFSYTEVGCFVDLEFHPGCLFGFAFDRFVFFDNLHPTNASNQIVAQAMIDRLNEIKPEPEPEPESESLILPIAALKLLLLDD